jgi:hypothetical protein
MTRHTTKTENFLVQNIVACHVVLCGVVSCAVCIAGINCIDSIFYCVVCCCVVSFAVCKDRSVMYLYP